MLDNERELDEVEEEVEGEVVSNTTGGDQYQERHFSDGARVLSTAVGTPRQSVFVETGRGQTEEVQVGAPFGPTIEHVAEDAHYGGYFRVFLNGEEILDPAEAPATIEAGMRIALTSYDKVGNQYC